MNRNPLEQKRTMYASYASAIHTFSTYICRELSTSLFTRENTCCLDKISIQLYDGILVFRFSLAFPDSFNSRNSNKLNSRYSTAAVVVSGADAADAMQNQTKMCVVYMAI